MKEYIKTYMTEINNYIANSMKNVSLDEHLATCKEFDEKLAHFMHERLIHLIVTVLFALMEIISIYVMAVTMNVTAIVLSIMFLVLLVPYVMHYYFLENSVQEMYKMRDTLVKFTREKQADKA